MLEHEATLSHLLPVKCLSQRDHGGDQKHCPGSRGKAASGHATELLYTLLTPHFPSSAFPAHHAKFSVGVSDEPHVDLHG